MEHFYERTSKEPIYRAFYNYMCQEADFSGGGQGSRPKPPPKIRGSFFRREQEKKKSYPKPLPKPPKQQPPKPK